MECVSTKTGHLQRAGEAGLRSKMDLKTNPDGSVGTSFGPASPNGFEKNRIPIMSCFDQRWPLPDLNLIATARTISRFAPSRLCVRTKRECESANTE